MVGRFDGPVSEVAGRTVGSGLGVKCTVAGRVWGGRSRITGLGRRRVIMGRRCQARRSCARKLSRL